MAKADPQPFTVQVDPARDWYRPAGASLDLSALPAFGPPLGAIGGFHAPMAAPSLAGGPTPHLGGGVQLPDDGDDPLLPEPFVRMSTGGGDGCSAQCGPVGVDRGWHLRQTGIEAGWGALQAAGHPAGGDGIVIAHVDTGVDKAQARDWLGDRLLWDRARDVVQDTPGAPPVAGPLGQPEHGLGTLTLLAGRGALPQGGPYSGVAWAASVFPVRAGHNVID
jgi:hypothetical protein